VTGRARLTRRRLFEVASAGVVSLAGGWLASRRVAPGTGPADLVTAPTGPTVPQAEDLPAEDEVAEPDPEPAPEAPQRYEPVPGEVEPEAKTVAARVVEALTTYEAGRSADAAARALTFSQTPDDPGLVAEAWPLLVEGATSQGRIVYPQLGGLDPHVEPRACSVMVVVSQELLRDGERRTVSRCVDVRLRSVDGTWRLDRVADASGESRSRPPVVSAAAERVLDHPGIVLPDSARWDIYDGRIDDRVLEELAIHADLAPLSVASFVRGHPEHVFGTDRRSAHMSGLAVDIWAVGGEPVVLQQPQRDDDAYEVAQDVFEGARASNFGSPWAFDGFGGRSFHDPVHRDHFHLGFATSASNEPAPSPGEESDEA
jgi:hypothetical protein